MLKGQQEKCPACGAPIDIKGQKCVKCAYCGTQFFVQANQDEKKDTAKKRNHLFWIIIIAILAFFLIVLNALYLQSCHRLWYGKPSPTTSASSTSTIQLSEPERDMYIPAVSATDDKSIEKGSHYSLMTDRWTVYTATAATNSVIGVDKWGKTFSSDKEMQKDYQVGMYKCDDSDEFRWVDDEHTAFILRFQDEKRATPMEMKERVFTIDIDEEVYKGSDYHDSIKSFLYENDKWHEYRAIQLSEPLIKIECWSRMSTDEEYVYGWDVCVINWEKDDVDFEWADDSHDAFSCRLRDYQNSYWDEDSIVLFYNENAQYSYGTVYDYLSE